MAIYHIKCKHAIAYKKRNIEHVHICSICTFLMAFAFVEILIHEYYIMSVHAYCIVLCFEYV